jgi:hypothetical protein
VLCLQVSGAKNNFVTINFFQSLIMDTSLSFSYCSPFGQDTFLLTAQIAAILATTISWVWWPVLVLSAPVVSVLQVMWCCEMRKRGLYAVVVLSFLAFLLASFISIWMFTECWGAVFVVLENQDNYCYSYRENAAAWGVVALVDALLFLLVAMSTWYFVQARYDVILAARVKEQEQDETYVPTVEMSPQTATAIAMPLHATEKAVLTA